MIVKKFCSFIAKPNLVLGVVLVYTVLSASFLSMVSFSMMDLLFELAIPLCFLAVFSFVWRHFIEKKKINVFPFVIFAALSVWEIVLLFIRKTSGDPSAFWQTYISVLININLFLVFESTEEENGSKPLNLYLVCVLIMDVLSLFITYDNGLHFGFLTDYHTMNMLIGVSSHPNLLGMLNLCGIFCAAYLLVKNAPKKRVGGIVLSAAEIVLFTVILIMTYCRTGVVSLICFVLSALIFLPLCLIRDRKKAIAVFLVICVIIVIFAAALAVVEISAANKGTSVLLPLLKSSGDTGMDYLVDKGGSGAEYSKMEKYETLTDYVFSDGFLSGRMDRWKKYIILSKENPVTGVGQGYIRSIYVERFAPKTLIDDFENPPQYGIGNILWEYAHNSYIQVLVSDGFPAFILFMIGIAVIIVKCFIVFLKRRSLSDMILFGSILALLVFNLAESSMTITYRSTGLFIWIFAAFLCNVDFKKIEKR